MDGGSKDGKGKGASNTEKAVGSSAKTSDVRKSSRSRKKSKRVLDGADVDSEILDVPAKKKNGGKRIKVKKGRKDVLENGRPFVCSLCESKCINPSNVKGKVGPVLKERDGRMLQLCVDCAIAYSHTENKGPSQEQRQQFEEEGRQFAQHLATYLADTEATRLYCSFYAIYKCGCIQNFISGVGPTKRKKYSCSDPDIPSLLPEECMDPPDEKADKAQRATYLLQLLKESKNRKKAQRTKRSRTSSNQSVSSVRSMDSQSGGETDTGSSSGAAAINQQGGQLDPNILSQKRLENFILVHRAKLKKIGICERGCQRVLCYSNNFLHKKSVFGKEARLQRTKGRAALGQLDPVEDLPNISCCDKYCVKFAELKPGKVSQWRSQAQQSQRESWKVISEMLTSRHITGGPQHVCCRFISLVTGCCMATVRKVYAETLLSKGQVTEREHGLRFHWRRQKQSLSESSATLTVKPEPNRQHKYGAAHPAAASSTLTSQQITKTDLSQAANETSLGSPATSVASGLSSTSASLLKAQTSVKREVALQGVKVIVSSSQQPSAGQRVIIAPPQMVANARQTALSVVQASAASQISNAPISLSSASGIPVQSAAHLTPLLLSYIQGPLVLPSAPEKATCSHVASVASKNTTTATQSAALLAEVQTDSKKFQSILTQSSLVTPSMQTEATTAVRTDSTLSSKHSFRTGQQDLSVSSSSIMQLTPLQASRASGLQHNTPSDAPIRMSSFSKAVSSAQQLGTSSPMKTVPDTSYVNKFAPSTPESSKVQQSLEFGSTASLSAQASASQWVKSTEDVDGKVKSQYRNLNAMNMDTQKQTASSCPSALPGSFTKVNSSSSDSQKQLVQPVGKSNLSATSMPSMLIGAPLSSICDSMPPQTSVTSTVQSSIHMSKKFVEHQTNSPFTHVQDDINFQLGGEEEASIESHQLGQTLPIHNSGKQGSNNQCNQGNSEQLSKQTMLQLPHSTQIEAEPGKSNALSGDQEGKQQETIAIDEQRRQILGQQDFTLIKVLENGVQKLYVVPKGSSSSSSLSAQTSLTMLPPTAVPLNSSALLQGQEPPLSLPIEAPADLSFLLTKSLTPNTASKPIRSRSSTGHITTTSIDLTHDAELKLMTSHSALNGNQACKILPAFEAYSATSGDSQKVLQGNCLVSSEPRMSSMVQASTHSPKFLPSDTEQAIMLCKSLKGERISYNLEGPLIYSSRSHAVSGTKDTASTSSQSFLSKSTELLSDIIENPKTCGINDQDMQSNTTSSLSQIHSSYPNSIEALPHCNDPHVQSSEVVRSREHSAAPNGPLSKDSTALSPADMPFSLHRSEGVEFYSAASFFVPRSENVGPHFGHDGIGINSDLIHPVTCSPSSFQFDALSDSPVSSLQMSSVLNEILSSSSRRLSFGSRPASGLHAQMPMSSPEFFKFLASTRSGSSSSSCQSPVAMGSTSTNIASAAASLLIQSQASGLHYVDDVFPRLTTLPSPVCGSGPDSCSTLNCATHTTPSASGVLPNLISASLAHPPVLTVNDPSVAAAHTLKENRGPLAFSTNVIEAHQRNDSSAVNISENNNSCRTTKDIDRQVNQVAISASGNLLSHPGTNLLSPANQIDSTLCPEASCEAAHTAPIQTETPRGAMEKTTRRQGSLLLETLLRSDSSFDAHASDQDLKSRKSFSVPVSIPVTTGSHLTVAAPVSIAPSNTFRQKGHSGEGCGFNQTGITNNDLVTASPRPANLERRYLHVAKDPDGQSLTAQLANRPCEKPETLPVSHDLVPASYTSSGNIQSSSIAEIIQPPASDYVHHTTNVSVGISSQQSTVTYIPSCDISFVPLTSEALDKDQPFQENNTSQGCQHHLDSKRALVFLPKEAFGPPLLNQSQRNVAHSVRTTACPLSETSSSGLHVTPVVSTNLQEVFMQHTPLPVQSKQTASGVCLPNSVQSDMSLNNVQAQVPSSNLSFSTGQGMQQQPQEAALSFHVALSTATGEGMGYIQEAPKHIQVQLGSAGLISSPSSLVNPLQPSHHENSGTLAQAVQIVSANGDKQFVLLPQQPNELNMPQQQQQPQKEVCRQDAQPSKISAQVKDTISTIQDHPNAQPQVLDKTNLNFQGVSTATAGSDKPTNVVQTSVAPPTSEGPVWMTLPIAQPQRGNTSSGPVKPPKQRRLMPKLQSTTQQSKPQPRSSWMLVPDKPGYPSLPLSQIDPALLSGLAPGGRIQLKPIVTQAEVSQTLGSTPVIMSNGQQLLVQSLQGQLPDLSQINASSAQSGLKLLTVPIGNVDQSKKASIQLPNSCNPAQVITNASPDVYQHSLKTQPNSLQTAFVGQNAEIKLQATLHQADEIQLPKQLPSFNPSPTHPSLPSSQVEQPVTILAEAAQALSTSTQKLQGYSESQSYQLKPAVVSNTYVIPSSSPAHQQIGINVPVNSEDSVKLASGHQQKASDKQLVQQKHESANAVRAASEVLGQEPSNLSVIIQKLVQDGSNPFILATGSAGVSSIMPAVPTPTLAQPGAPTVPLLFTPHSFSSSSLANNTSDYNGKKHLGHAASPGTVSSKQSAISTSECVSAISSSTTANDSFRPKSDTPRSANEYHTFVPKESSSVVAAEESLTSGPSSSLQKAVYSNTNSTLPTTLLMTPDHLVHQQGRQLNVEQAAVKQNQGRAHDYEIIDLTDDNLLSPGQSQSKPESQQPPSNLLLRELSKNICTTTATCSAMTSSTGGLSSVEVRQTETLKLPGNHQQFSIQGKQRDDLRFKSYQSLQTLPILQDLIQKESQKQDQRVENQQAMSNIISTHANFLSANEVLLLPSSQQASISLPAAAGATTSVPQSGSTSITSNCSMKDLPQATGMSKMVLVLPENLHIRSQQPETGRVNVYQRQVDSQFSLACIDSQASHQHQLSTNSNMLTVSTAHCDSSRATSSICESLPGTPPVSGVMSVENFSHPSQVALGFASNKNSRIGQPQTVTSMASSSKLSLSELSVGSKIQDSKIAAKLSEHEQPVSASLVPQVSSSTKLPCHSQGESSASVNGPAVAGQMNHPSSIRRPSSIPICGSAASVVTMSPAQAPTFRRTSNTPTDAVGPPNITIVSPSGSSPALLLKFNTSASSGSSAQPTFHLPSVNVSASAAPTPSTTAANSSTPSLLFKPSTTMSYSEQVKSKMTTVESESHPAAALTPCTSSSNEALQQSSVLPPESHESRKTSFSLPPVSALDNSAQALRQRLLQSHLNPGLKKVNKSRKRCTKTVNDLLKMSSTLHAKKALAKTPESSALSPGLNSSAPVAIMLPGPGPGHNVVLVANPAAPMPSLSCNKANKNSLEIDTSERAQCDMKQAASLAETKIARLDQLARPRILMQHLEASPHAHPEPFLLVDEASSHLKPSQFAKKNGGTALVGKPVIDSQSNRHLEPTEATSSQTKQHSRKCDTDSARGGAEERVPFKYVKTVDKDGKISQVSVNSIREGQFSSQSFVNAASLEQNNGPVQRVQDKPENNSLSNNNDREGHIPAEHPTGATFPFNNLGMPYSQELPHSTQTLSSEIKESVNSGQSSFPMPESSMVAEESLRGSQHHEQITIRSYTSRAPPAYEEATRRTKGLAGNGCLKSVAVFESATQVSQSRLLSLRATKEPETPVHNHDRIGKIIDDIYTPSGEHNSSNHHLAGRPKAVNSTSPTHGSAHGLEYTPLPSADFTNFPTFLKGTRENGGNALKRKMSLRECESGEQLNPAFLHSPPHGWKVPGTQKRVPNKGKGHAHLKRVQFSDDVSKELELDSSDLFHLARTDPTLEGKAKWGQVNETDFQDHNKLVWYGDHREVSSKHHVAKQTKRNESTAELKQQKQQSLNTTLGYADYRRHLSQDMLKPTPTTKPLSAVKYLQYTSDKHAQTGESKANEPEELGRSSSLENLEITEARCPVASSSLSFAGDKVQNNLAVRDYRIVIGGAKLSASSGVDNPSSSSFSTADARPSSFEIISPQGYKRLNRQRLLSTTSSESSCSPQVESRPFPPHSAEPQSKHASSQHQLLKSVTSCLSWPQKKTSKTAKNVDGHKDDNDDDDDNADDGNNVGDTPQRMFQTPLAERLVSQSPVLRHDVIQADYELSQQMKQNSHAFPKCFPRFDPPLQQQQQRDSMKPVLKQARFEDRDAIDVHSPGRVGSNTATSEEDLLSLRGLSHSPSNSSVNSPGSDVAANLMSASVGGTVKRIWHLVEGNLKLTSGNYKLTSQNEMLRREVTRAEQQAGRYQPNSVLPPAPTPGATSVDSEESGAGAAERDSLASPLNNFSLPSTLATVSSGEGNGNGRSKHPSSSSILKHCMPLDQEIGEDDSMMALVSSLSNNRRRHLSSGLRFPVVDIDSFSYQDPHGGRVNILPTSPSSLVTTKVGSPYSEFIPNEYLRNIGSHHDDPFVSSSILRPSSQLDLLEVSSTAPGFSSETNQYRQRYPSSSELKQISTSASSSHYQGFEMDSPSESVRPRNLSSSLGLCFNLDPDHPFASVYERQRNPSSSSMKDGNGNGNGSRSRNPSSSSLMRHVIYGDIPQPYSAVRSRNPSGSSSRRSRPGSSSSDREFFVNPADDLMPFADFAHSRSRNSSGDSNLEPTVAYVPIDLQLYINPKKYGH